MVLNSRRHETPFTVPHQSVRSGSPAKRIVAFLASLVCVLGVATGMSTEAAATGTTDGSPISVGVNPTGIAISGDRAYVVNKGSNSVTVIDLSTNSVVNTILLDFDEPSSIAVGGGYIFVASYNGALERIDSTTYAISAMSGHSATRALAYSPLNKLVLAREQGADVIDLGTMVKSSITLDSDHGYAAFAAGNFAYVATPGRLWKLDISGAINGYPDPNTSAALVYGTVTGEALEGGRLWVTPAAVESYGASTVSVLDVGPSAPLVTQAVPVGNGPTRIAISGGNAFVTNGTASLTMIDTTTFAVSTKSVGFSAADIAVIGDLAYLVNPAGSVSVISLAAPPVATSVSPSSGSASGGTAVEVNGSGFVAGATVSIGDTACTSVTFTSATSLSCTTPAGTAGAANVVVTNPDAQTSTLTGGFTYTSSGGGGGGGGNPDPATVVTPSASPTPTASATSAPVVTPSAVPSAPVVTAQPVASVPAGVAVLSVAERSTAQVVTVPAPASTSIALAPVVTVPANTPVAPVVGGLPASTPLQVGMSAPAFTRMLGQASPAFAPIGTTRSNAAGRAKVPAFKASRPGTYTIRLATASGKAYYLKVTVAARGQRRR